MKAPASLFLLLSLTISYGPTLIHGFEESGVCSWYGAEGHGHFTASGEIYNMYAMTAAHKTLPFGTMVKVTNKKNGRSLDLRITDRGPFVAGRIIDVSKAAAQALGFHDEGIVDCSISSSGGGGHTDNRVGGGSCLDLWANNCDRNDDCCSKNCVRGNPGWKYGVCRP